ncbi:nuclear transport factor 2 family protein [Aggregatimonas sangjinii]|uniref:Nuclear transport factor 2 family protein n=1 Tax=Aggregatimonas sangjinii TaxID=2583587 RepID=A0A5B7SU44_9FLAO|nr:nuclear transport factor 2 family protein [Aggregatimonas sangjinii]QCX00244.1 nuclear transport factor 2 family protein [Aggregatimonas sangjinii]
MHIIYLFIGLCSMTMIRAQDPITLQKDIDQNVWKPFQLAFENNDGPGLNSLYAEEVLRVTPAGIDTENEFKAANLKRFEENRAKKTSVQLDFWFDSRKTNATTSYEVGFYRILMSNTDGVNTIYGQFHIVLKKIDGVWKIVQDWDTATIGGIPIKATDFERQQPIRFE